MIWTLLSWNALRLKTGSARLKGTRYSSPRITWVIREDSAVITGNASPKAIRLLSSKCIPVTVWQKAIREIIRICTTWDLANGKEPFNTVWSRDINSVSWLLPTSIRVIREAMETEGSACWQIGRAHV